ITDQLSVLGCRGSTFAGDAAKRVIVGKLDCASPISGSPAHRRKTTVVVRIAFSLLIGRSRPKSISHHFTLYLKHLTHGSLHPSCILGIGRYEIASTIGPPQNTKYQTNPLCPPTRTKQSRFRWVCGAGCWGSPLGPAGWHPAKSSNPPPIPSYPFSAQSPAAGDIVITRGGRPTRPDNLTMPLTRRFLLACATAGLIFAQPAPQKQLTARELFHAAAPAPAAVKPAAARPPPPAPPHTPAQT